MKAVLKDEVIIQVFSVKANGYELQVTWNRDNHTEDSNTLVYVPEFLVEDEDGELLDKGCQDWKEAVAAVKNWEN